MEFNSMDGANVIKSEGERDYLEDPGVEGSIVIKMLIRHVESAWDYINLAQEPMVDICKEACKLSAFTKCYYTLD
jgi:hypothetical protein